MSWLGERWEDLTGSQWKNSREYVVPALGLAAGGLGLYAAGAFGAAGGAMTAAEAATAFGWSDAAMGLTADAILAEGGGALAGGAAGSLAGAAEAAKAAGWTGTVAGFLKTPAGIAALGTLGSVYSGSMQAGAAKDAAQMQANSANQANQLQYQMFQEQQKLMQPWVTSGQQNLERLNYAMYGQAPQSPGDRVIPAPGPRPAETRMAPDSLAGGLTANQMGVQAGGLNPDWRFSTEDWKNSPEYEVYNNARDAALTRSQDALMAQGAASGMYGSGTMANQLSQNMGQLYAQYDPLSLQTAQQNAVAARQNQYNQMVGMASPTGAQQVGQWAQNYGQIAGANMIGAGNAQAAGQVGSANAWGNALTSGTNQLSNAYGQYQGQQNFNQWAQMYGGGYNPQGYGSPSMYDAAPYQQQFTPAGSSYQV